MPLTRNQVVLLFLSALVVVVASGLPTPFSWPTYWDGTLGPVTQAIWLKEHNFDYRALVQDVPGYFWGGPRVYLWSIYPPLMAGVMKLTGSPQGFLAVMHLLHYLMAAGCVGVATGMARRALPWLPVWVTPLLLLSQPFFLTQAAAINLEMPVLLASLLAIRAYWMGRWPACLLWLMAGFAVKASIIPLGMTCAAAFAVSRTRSPRDWLRVVALASPYLLSQVLSTVEMLHGNLTQGDGGSLALDRLWQWQAWVVMGIQALSRTPDLVLVGFGLVLAALAMAFRTLRQREFSCPERRAALELPVWLIAGGGQLLLITVCLTRTLPRYTFSFFPILLGGFLLVGARVSRPIWSTAAGLWIALNLANLNGGVARAIERATAPILWAGQTPPSEALANNGHILERSLECRTDIRLQQEVARILERDYPDRVVVTTWPLLHQFRSPWFGYVTRPLTVMASHRPGMQWAGVEQYWKYMKEHPDHGGHAVGDFVWVWTENVFAFPRLPEKNRTLLREVEVGGRKILLYAYTDWPVEPARPTLPAPGS